MTIEEKIFVVKDLCGRLPFHVKVAIDFKGYLEVLPDDENLQYPYRKNLKFILDRDNKTIKDISKEPNILYAYPCTERFQMLRGYTYELDYGVPVEFIKPYLRPMSNMTKEEIDEYIRLQHKSCIDVERPAHCCKNSITAVVVFLTTRETVRYWYNDMVSIDTIDFLNSRHFDYRGLIEKGVALEAPEGMYETKIE